MIAGNWQRRWHPLLDQWVLVSARSAARPWSGALATANQSTPESFDSSCYLCPRVKRASGAVNPDYVGAYAFDNDFPSLSPDAPDTDTQQSNVLERVAPAHGQCRVLCWSERHDVTLASLSAHEMQNVVELWKREYTQLSQDPNIAYVLIFENKGTEIGVSNLHPHGQIYATSFVTDTAMRMRRAQTSYTQSNNGKSLLQDMLALQHTQDKLLVESSEHFSVIVPFAARFAYETWIVPHRKVGSLSGMSDAEIADLAAIYQRQVRRYDLLFQRSAPNITLIHNAPCNHAEADLNKHWCFHLGFQPPLRDPEKLKFLAGFESGSNNVVNPVQAEHAAQQLRGIDLEQWQT